MSAAHETLFDVPDRCAEEAAGLVRLDRLPRSGDERADLERYCRAAWTRIAEPGNQWSHAMVAQLGPVAALAAAAERSERVVDQFRPRLAQLDVPRDLDIAARFGARLLVPGDAEWPAGVDDLDMPPFALWVRGHLDLQRACSSSVAVVGARACTQYGSDVAGELGWELASRGFSVVSGAAYGIDAAAHRGALAAGGFTAAVLACGIDQHYPAAHADLLRTIAERGSVVSEVAPGSAALRSRFLQRNRLIATMTQGTVVVEAGLRSGSKNTAGTAARHHRVVMAVPGSVKSMASAGCNELVRSGMAQLVTDADDVSELLRPVGEGLGPERRAPRQARDDLPPDDARVLDALTSRSRSVAKIADVSGLSLRAATAVLGRLDALGFATPTDTGWRRVSSGSGR